MVSPDQQKAASRKLTHWIENERKIVTYRDVSREVGCHVNVAKNILLEHLTSHPELAATYLLTGPLLATSTITQTQLPSLNPEHGSSTQRVRIVDMDEMSEGDRNSEDGDDLEDGREGVDLEEVGNDHGAEGGLEGGIHLPALRSGGDEGVLEREEVARWGVVLIDQDGLEEKKKLFEQYTLGIHIYSLAPTPIKDPAQYLIPSLTLRQHANYHNPEVYGTISGDAFEPSLPVQAEKKPMKDGEMDWGSSKAKKVGGKAEEKRVSVRVEPKKSIFGNASTSTGNTKTASAAPATAAATTPALAPTPPAATDKPGASASSSSKKAPSGSASSKKKRVIQSDTEEDEPAPPAASAAASASSQSTNKAGTSKKAGSGPTSSMVRADDQKAMEAMMSMDMDMDMDMGLDEDDDGETTRVAAPTSAEKKRGKGRNSGGAQDEVQVKKDPGTGGRKKRKVRKTVVEENAKGYMVSKDVWVEESCSDNSEAEQETEPAKPIRKTSSNTNVGKPSMKARDSTSSIGSTGNQGKSSGPGSSASNPSSGGAKKAGAAGGAGLRGQSTLKGFFTKK